MTLALQTPQHIADILIGGSTLSTTTIKLSINQFAVTIRSNSESLLDWCRYYYKDIIQPDTINAHIEIIAIERKVPDLDINYKNWIRASNKKARKDMIYDIPGARILKKVRTNMIFLQSRTHLIAAGECLKNKDQIINFINAQYMTFVQNQQAVVCHAAGLVIKNKSSEHALGLAGFSGGGKSTLMLHMLAQSNTRFLSNDRLFLKKISAEKTLAFGIPKLPRINPGTIIHNPMLKHLITKQQRDELKQLPNKKLWALEEKYDVFISEIYGPDKVQYQSNIKHFVVLNWQHDSTDPVTLTAVNLSQRKDLLAAIMKPPGPFYQYDNGDLYQHTSTLNEKSYLDVFQNITVYEACGGVDFDALGKLCFQKLFSESP